MQLILLVPYLGSSKYLDSKLWYKIVMLNVIYINSKLQYTKNLGHALVLNNNLVLNLRSCQLTLKVKLYLYVFFFLLISFRQQKYMLSRSYGDYKELNTILFICVIFVKAKVLYCSISIARRLLHFFYQVFFNITCLPRTIIANNMVF